MSSIPFFVVHLLPFLAIFTGVTWTAVILCLVTYWTRMFFITAGYHRYFSHRSYRTSRAFQFVLAFGGTTAAQKGPLWWAGHHRIHHRYTDTEMDPHTPRKGFWWSHAGWILARDTKDMPEGTMKDFARFPRDPVRLEARLDRTVDAGDRLLPDRRAARTADRVLPVHGPAVALDVPDQLTGARLRAPPVRHRRHEPQQRPARPAHHG